MIRAKWDLAFKAFQGAFNTPIARRKQDDEYAADARQRITEFNEKIRNSDLLWISRAELSLALNCLDRDAAEGKVSRAEIAAEIRKNIETLNKPVPLHTDLGDWLK